MRSLELLPSAEQKLLSDIILGRKSAPWSTMDNALPPFHLITNAHDGHNQIFSWMAAQKLVVSKFNCYYLARNLFPTKKNSGTCRRR